MQNNSDYNKTARINLAESFYCASIKHKFQKQCNRTTDTSVVKIASTCGIYLSLKSIRTRIAYGVQQETNTMKIANSVLASLIEADLLLDCSSLLSANAFLLFANLQQKKLGQKVAKKNIL